ncbi:MAG: Na/Pi cotransporter family protein [Paludibacteraceae bacterium]|nr:Na/Pi cotransporter family protein [Paludibacteraceae bacterium]
MVNAISILTAILTLLAGIGVFLVACTMMSSNLESAASRRLKRLFTKTGDNKWIGVGIGTLGTAAIQSSGAVTVMIIGFVNVGIMSLTQAATIIYGANIGTTVTAQLVALGLSGSSSFSTTLLFASLASVGAFIMLFTKVDSWKKIGGILTGFGMLFVGLSMMSSAMDEFAALQSVKLFLASIRNPLLLVLLGAVITAVIQSSSVMTSIAITMVVSGLIDLDQGIYLTMGSNIGSCVVAIIAGMASGVAAKRTAMIHLLFNVLGVVLFLCSALLLNILTSATWSFGTIFEYLFPTAPQLQLAMFHTVFNLCTMLVALPLTNSLVELSCRIIKDKPVEKTNEPHLFFLDPQMLRTPVVAIRQLKAEVENMAMLAIENYRRSVYNVTTLDDSKRQIFDQTETQLNYLNRELVHYALLLSNNQLNRFDHQYLVSTIRTVSDLERIGDYAKNINEYADSLRQQQVRFSDYALKEIGQMNGLIDRLYEASMQAYHKMDLGALGLANQIEEEVDQLTDEMERNHIQRLALGICKPQAGTEYISLAQNSERIADHLINVAKTIRDLQNV